MRRQQALRQAAKRKRATFVLASAWVYLALLSPALGAEVTLQGRTVTFEPPAGYCLLNELTEGERQTVQAMRRLRQPDQDLIWMFVRCDQLAAVRAGAAGLEQFGYVTALRPRGAFQAVRGTSRFDFTRKVARAMPPMDAAGTARELRRRPPIQDATRFNLLHSGLTAIDAAAAYLGLVVEESAGRSRSVTAGVTAITLVRDLPMSVTLHGPFSGISYPILRSELRPLLGDFITRNEPGARPFEQRAAEPPRGIAGWWRSLALFGIAVAASVLTAIVVIRTRRRLSHPPAAPHRPLGGHEMPARHAI